jgi:hypothetical protein
MCKRNYVFALHSSPYVSLRSHSLVYVSTDMNFFPESEIGIQQSAGRFHTIIQTAGDISHVDLGQVQADSEAQFERCMHEFKIRLIFN